MTTVVAIDAMGGDRAPGAIVAGAIAAIREVPDVHVLLVGDSTAIKSVLPEGGLPPEVEILHASETIAMAEEPAAAVRTKKDSSIVRAAEAVRDGKADAMIGAGNTGATMAGALLRMGRIKGVARPAIAVPIPVPGAERPQLLVDGGATVDCQPEWLVQWAHLAVAYARLRLGVDAPTIGLLSNGEEAGKGDALRKAAFPLLQGIEGFTGNCEGRDLISNSPDIVLTDGFTGNVALKTMEGAMQRIAAMVFDVLSSTPEAVEAAKVVAPLLLAKAGELDPDATGGALLLGIDGICIISHGSSGERAVVSAVRVAQSCVRDDVIARSKEAIGRAG
ncbi:MAG: phosphate:acyl-(acyl carrier protein) acyltransferase [Actinomycetia bacterium]|nr:phosphate:acyl-(acyl carrier protein) acyltransferase [Actinomycetes bacterium]